MEQTYFGVNDEAVADRTDGAHRFVQQFDRFRNSLLKLYFDESGRPINNTQGFHRVVSTYNKYGDELENRWYDKDGLLCNGPDDVHRISYDYDDRGLLVNVAVYDAEDHPALNKSGIHKTCYDYNDKRQQTKYQVFGLNGEPAEDIWGSHLALNEFDKRGRETKVTLIRADGSPNWDCELGIATRTQLWDKENRWREQAYFDEKDRPVIGLHGFARAKRNIKSDGSITDIIYGTNGKPMFNALMGWAIRERDSQGNTTSYHGPDGALINGPSGCAEMRCHWSEDGVLLSVAFFGPDGRTPIVGPGGYHQAEQTADGKRYFDARGAKITSFGPEAFVSVIYISEIPSIGQIFAVKQPAAKAGLHAGDILWRYGNWSFPEALDTERAKGTADDAIVGVIAQAFIAEIKRINTQSVSMTVIRNEKATAITVPPLPNKLLGIQMKDRTVPVGTFNAWKVIAAEKKSVPHDP